jgi:hypothetical protein
MNEMEKIHPSIFPLAGMASLSIFLSLTRQAIQQQQPKLFVVAKKYQERKKELKNNFIESE